MKLNITNPDIKEASMSDEILDGEHGDRVIHTTATRMDGVELSHSLRSNITDDDRLRSIAKDRFEEYWDAQA